MSTFTRGKTPLPVIKHIFCNTRIKGCAGISPTFVAEIYRYNNVWYTKYTFHGIDWADKGSVYEPYENELWCLEKHDRGSLIKALTKRLKL